MNFVCNSNICNKFPFVASYHNSGQTAFVSNTSCQSLCGESSGSSCVKCKQCGDMKYLLKPHACEEDKNLNGNRNQTCQRVSAKDSHIRSLNLNQTVELSDSSSRTIHVKCHEGSLPTYKSKGIKKGRHQTRPVENEDLDVQIEESSEAATHSVAADKNIYGCLTVDQGLREETMTFNNKVQHKIDSSCATFVRLVTEETVIFCNKVQQLDFT